MTKHIVIVFLYALLLLQPHSRAQAQDDRIVRTLHGPQSVTLSVEWSPDGSRIVTTHDAGKAIVWDVATGRQLLTLNGHALGSNVLDAGWSPDSARIVTAGGDARARVWDARTGNQLLVFSNHTGAVQSAN